MKIVFDLRESGTTTGRYMDKLIENLQLIDTVNTYVLLVKPDKISTVPITNPNFSIIECPIKEFTLAEQTTLLTQINKLKPDLVHFSIVQQPILYRGKSVTTIHDLTTLRFVNPTKNFLVFKFKQLIYYFVNYIAVRKSEKVITPTQWVVDDCKKTLHLKDTSKFTVTLESSDDLPQPSELIVDLQGKDFIMYVGRHQPHKNLDRLIEAFIELQKTKPELCLAIIGKTDAATEKIQEKHSAIKNLIFTGFVSERQLRWAYENTRCYVFPSLSEGFGLPSIEAMRHGAPVACSNATCLPEVNGDAALYFDPLNHLDIAEKISQILDNEDVRAELIGKGKVHADTFSWKRMAEQTLEVYKSINI